MWVFILSYFFGPFRLQIGNAPVCGGSFSLVKMTLKDFFSFNKLSTRANILEREFTTTIAN